MGGIMRQLDATDVPGAPDNRVAFVEYEEVLRGRGLGEWTEHRYFAAIHALPMSPANAVPLKTCGHRHQMPHQAHRCARRMLREAGFAVDA